MKKLLVLIAITFLPLSAFSSDNVIGNKIQGSGPNPFTECGIGGAIFPTVHWAAATSNVIWDLGITAITSAISSPETCNAKKVKTAQLIIETLPELERDIVAGKGKYLAALNQTVGCKDSNLINANIRSSYSNVVSNEGYSSKSKAERASDMYNTVKNAVSSTSCNVVL